MSKNVQYGLQIHKQEEIVNFMKCITKYLKMEGMGWDIWLFNLT